MYFQQRRILFTLLIFSFLTCYCTLSGYTMQHVDLYLFIYFFSLKGNTFFLFLLIRTSMFMIRNLVQKIWRMQNLNWFFFFFNQNQFESFCDPMDCSSSLHGILQAKILKWVAIPFSRGIFQPRNQTQVSCITGGFFTDWATREALESFWFGLKMAFIRFIIFTLTIQLVT